MMTHDVSSYMILAVWWFKNSKLLKVCHPFKHLDTHPSSSKPTKRHPSKCSKRELSHKWKNRILILICPPNAHSCHKHHNHGNTMEICLQADHQTCHKCCTGGKHYLIVIPNCSPNISHILHKWKAPHNSDPRLYSKVVTNAAQVEITT